MSKESSPARKPGRAADAAKPKATRSPQPGKTSSDLVQTEAFTMAPEEDSAADFLLGGDDDADAGGGTEVIEAPPPALKPRPAGKVKTPAVKPSTSMDETTAPAEETPIRRAARKAMEPEKTEMDTSAQESAQQDSTAQQPEQASEPAPARVPEKVAPPQQNAQKATLLGDYRLLKKLGQGGMGSVYRAHQVTLDREVAVKVLAKELSGKPAFVQRFLREARVMVKLDHPNILRCFDVGTASGYHYLAMEFVDGGSVEGWLKKLRRFSLGDALHVIMVTAAALQHAHEQGFVHRDIKPDNILLTSKGHIKLADLGLAKATDDDLGLTKTGTGAGTPYYMAPEQARDVKHVDGRVDIYALGVMLYVFLSGEMPFRGETLVEVIESKEKGKFPSIRKFNDEVPEKLELVMGKMMAARPEHRYATCAEVIADLEEFGLSNDRLSFVENAQPMSSTGLKQAVVKTSMPQPRSTEKTSVAGKASTQAPREEPKSDSWYWAFENEDGQRVVKKLSKDKIITLIKSGSIDTDAQVSRTKTGFRSVATFGEFLPYLQKNIITEKVEKKGDKYREMYKQIEQEEKSRQRWRWLHNIYLKLGGGVGFLLWMCIVAAVVVGGYFGVRWLIEYLGTTVADKAGLK